jgi:hypothetical protein
VIDRGPAGTDGFEPRNGYVVTHDGRSLPAFDSALLALDTCIALRRQDHENAFSVHVEDEGGTSISFAQLLTDAQGEAAEEGEHRWQPRLDSVLADYVDVMRDVAASRAYETWTALTNGEEPSDAPEIRRRDERDFHQARDVLFHRGDWREAGWAWGREFERAVPQPVLNELERRHGSRFGLRQLQRGVRGGLIECALDRRRDPDEQVATHRPREAGDRELIARRREQRLRQVLGTDAAPSLPTSIEARPAPGRRP